MNLRRWDTLQLALAAMGMGVMVYLTIVHYAGDSILACPASGIINCERVLTSPESIFLGVPVSVLGIVWFVVVAGLAAVSLRMREAEPHWLANAGVAWSIAGMLMVLYLIYVELIVVGTICLWCTVGHVIITGVWALQLVTQRARSYEPVDSMLV